MIAEIGGKQYRSSQPPADASCTGCVAAAEYSKPQTTEQKALCQQLICTPGALARAGLSNRQEIRDGQHIIWKAVNK